MLLRKLSTATSTRFLSTTPLPPAPRYDWIAKNSRVASPSASSIFAETKKTTLLPSSFTSSGRQQMDLNPQSITTDQTTQQKRYVFYIYAGRNNTHVHLSLDGKTVGQASTGMIGLKKAARGTSDAGYNTAKHLIVNILQEKKGIYLTRECPYPVHVVFNGFGPGRDQAFRALKEFSGLGGGKIVRLSDKTPVRHGGCRPKQPRRV